MLIKYVVLFFVITELFVIMQILGVPLTNLLEQALQTLIYNNWEHVLLRFIVVHFYAVLFILFNPASLSRKFGSLVFSRWENFPLSNTFQLAKGTVLLPAKGFQVYCLTTRTVSHHVSPWFARWLLSQDIAHASTRLKITTRPGTVFPAAPSYRFLTTTFFVHLPMLVAALAMHDCWAVAYVGFQVVIIYFRQILRHNMRGIVQWETTAVEFRQSPNAILKFIIRLPGGRLVALECPQDLWRGPLSVNLERPADHNLVHRGELLEDIWVGGDSEWLRIYFLGGFVMQAITLGFSSLYLQIIALAFIAFGTFNTIREKTSVVVPNLIIRRYDQKYAGLMPILLDMDLEHNEEEALISWRLPVISVHWWEMYLLCKRAQYGGSSGPVIDSWVENMSD